MRLIVAGGRNFHNYLLLKFKLRAILKNVTEEIEIVHGNWKDGADQLAERFAKEHGYKVRHFNADWNQYGKAAGPIRNEEMAAYGTHCVAFWDKKSPGTGNMIDNATRYGLPTRVITF